MLRNIINSGKKGVVYGGVAAGGAAAVFFGAMLIQRLVKSKIKPAELGSFLRFHYRNTKSPTVAIFEDDAVRISKYFFNYEMDSGRFSHEANVILCHGWEMLNKIPVLKTDAQKLDFDKILVGTAIVAMVVEDTKNGKQEKFAKDFLYPKRLFQLYEICQISKDDQPSSDDIYLDKVKNLIERVGHHVLIERSLPASHVSNRQIYTYIWPLIDEIEERHEKMWRDSINDSLNIPTVLTAMVGDYVCGERPAIGKPGSNF